MSKTILYVIKLAESPNSYIVCVFFKYVNPLKRERMFELNFNVCLRCRQKAASAVFTDQLSNSNFVYNVSEQ